MHLPGDVDSVFVAWLFLRVLLSLAYLLLVRINGSDIRVFLLINFGKVSK